MHGMVGWEVGGRISGWAGSGGAQLKLKLMFFVAVF